MQQSDHLVDVRVHDGLSDERESAVAHGECLIPTVDAKSGEAAQLLDEALVLAHRFRDDHCGVVYHPAPLATDGVPVVPTDQSLDGIH